jgi:FkbM family methyltransferase
MDSTYLQQGFTDQITLPIKTIIECGSRDGKDAVEMNEYYHPDIIYTFECNPESIPVCEKNIEVIPNIQLIKKAVFHRNMKDLRFYATDMDKSIDKNIGASSLLWHKDQINYIQKKVLVDSIRLDTFMKRMKIDKVDLLCMDLQGTELLALKGLGKRIYDIHYIISEISFISYYHGDVHYKKLRGFLKDYGFDLVVRIGGDALFKNNKYE